MRMFFARINSQSVTEAKNRLKSVIKNDRINLTQSKTLEKMKKEVSAVLLKYTTRNAQPQVSVSCEGGSVCLLSASVPLKKEST